VHTRGVELQRDEKWAFRIWANSRIINLIVRSVECGIVPLIGQWKGESLLPETPSPWYKN